jgi:hypothetical protein
MSLRPVKFWRPLAEGFTRQMAALAQAGLAQQTYSGDDVEKGLDANAGLLA